MLSKICCGGNVYIYYASGDIPVFCYAIKEHFVSNCSTAVPVHVAAPIHHPFQKSWSLVWDKSYLLNEYQNSESPHPNCTLRKPGWNYHVIGYPGVIWNLIKSGGTINAEQEFVRTGWSL